jgi:hypothetical protein
MKLFFIEVVNTHDPRVVYSVRMTKVKLHERRGLIEGGRFKVGLREELPERSRLMNTRSVLSINYDNTGKELYKSRLVVRGFQDRIEKYLVHEPIVVRSTSVRMLIYLAAILGSTVGLKT